MRIPKADVVRFLISESLREGRIGSQKGLASAVNARLRNADPRYSLSDARARRIALETPGVRTRIFTRRGPAPTRCPACGNRIRKTFTRDLRGRKALLMAACTRCPYSSSGGRWLPMRYDFGLERQGAEAQRI
jgi:ribosomal protein L34E